MLLSPQHNCSREGHLEYHFPFYVRHVCGLGVGGAVGVSFCDEGPVAVDLHDTVNDRLAASGEGADVPNGKLRARGFVHPGECAGGDGGFHGAARDRIGGEPKRFDPLGGGSEAKGKYQLKGQQRGDTGSDPAIFRRRRVHLPSPFWL